MKAVEWRSLLIAASKSGSLESFLSTLQFLRPYLEAVHVSLAQNDERVLPKGLQYRTSFDDRDQMFGCTGQYAWCVRILCDWIEWVDAHLRRGPPEPSAYSLLEDGVGSE
jgi:hypothetical protein